MKVCLKECIHRDLHRLEVGFGLRCQDLNAKILSTAVVAETSALAFQAESPQAETVSIGQGKITALFWSVSAFMNDPSS